MTLSYKPIIRSASSVMLIMIVAKIFGYVEKLVLAYYFGTSYEVDGYLVVFGIVFTIFVLIRELVEPGFLVVFIKSREENDETGGWQFFNSIGRYIALSVIVLSIFGIIFPGEVVKIFAPGFKNEKLSITVQLVQIAFPAIIFYCLSALTYITLNGMKKFALPAAGDLLLKLLTISTLIVLYKTFGIKAAAIGLLVGSAGRLLTHLIPLYKFISFKRLDTDAGKLQHMWKLTWPLFFGVVFSQINTLFDNIFASYLQEGAVSAISYARKIIDLPIILFPSVLSIVIFPYLSTLSLENKNDSLKQLLGNVLKLVIIVFVPIMIFFCIYASPVVRILLERGAFNEYSTNLTAQPVFIYSFGLLSFSLETILVVFYFATRDVKTPVITGIIMAIINVLLSMFLIQFIGYLGIALSFVVAKTLKTLILLYLLKNKLIINNKNVIQFMIKITVSCLPFSLLLILSKIYISPHVENNMLNLISSILLTLMTGIGIYALSLNLMKIKIRKEF